MDAQVSTMVRFNNGGDVEFIKQNWQEHERGPLH